MGRRESMPSASTKLLVPLAEALALVEESVVPLISRRDLEKDEARRTSRGMPSSHTSSTSSRRRSASVRSDSQRTESIAAAVAASSSHVEAGSGPPAPSAFSSSSSPVASVHAARLRSSRSSSWALAVAASRSAPQSTSVSVRMSAASQRVPRSAKQRSDARDMSGSRACTAQCSASSRHSSSIVARTGESSCTRGRTAARPGRSAAARLSSASSSACEIGFAYPRGVRLLSSALMSVDAAPSAAARSDASARDALAVSSP